MSTNSSKTDENYDINEKTLDEQEDDESDYGTYIKCNKYCYLLHKN